MFDSNEFCLRPLTREKLDDLILAEGLQVAEELKPNALKPAERAELMPAAYTLIAVYRRILTTERERKLERS
ncbi:hypothetical protein LAJ19_13570 [Deinococcus taeanensis]|uniref:hypothetical protein n=1 Tax=Deinococcus taeanensis TaxID=2737050 RepID=UPI001CDD460A|nr:hypothetical protein [Deinococcus taeanensis]UBV42628.1 hypothetical protein LAJ19_13570 [Deinococcus taeanensis]